MVDKPLSTIDNPALPDIKRTDAYWVEPLLTALGLIAFGIYVTFRAFEFKFYKTGSMISPFYSPDLSQFTAHYGISPALVILPIPLLFRATCYYYRKAYYRAFFGDPTACGVKEALAPVRKNYSGERAFPLILQNIHRYAFYLAALVMAVLWWDTLLTFTHAKAGGWTLGMTLGSLVFTANVVLLSMYTFSCHSWRHLTGGCINCYSCSEGAKARHDLWSRISHLNENHQLWAWCSLFSVGLTDFYVRLVASGAFTDPRFF
ncbi:MAG: succinate dehydrogenase [Capsulimonadaceae bacterium]